MVTVLPPPGPSLGETIGAGFGQGLGTGLNEALQQMLQRRVQATQGMALTALTGGTPEEGKLMGLLNPQMQSLFMKKKQAQQKLAGKLAEPYDLKEFGAEAKAIGLNTDVITSEQFNILLNKTNELAKQIGRKAASQEVLTNVDKYLTPQIDTRGEELISQEEAAVPKKKETGLMQHLFGENKSFKRGLASGASGKMDAIMRGQNLEDYKKSASLHDKAGIWDNIMYAIGNFVSNSPYFAAGGTTGAAAGGSIGALAGPGGAAIGATVGGGIGAFSFPTFMNSSLTEFMKLKEKGDKGSFEDYLNSLSQVTSETAKSGAEGSIFATLGQVIPLLKAANPSMKKFFETTKFPELKKYLGKSTIQSLGLTATETAAERKLPSKEEVASTFANVFGMNLLQVGGTRGKAIIERIRKSHNPTEAINLTNDIAEYSGIAKDKLASGDPTEIKKLDKIVVDITKKYAGKIKPVEPQPELSKEVLEKRAEVPREEAEQLAKAPLEEYLKETPEKETPAQIAEKQRATKELSALDEKIDTTQRNLDKINSELSTKIKSKESRSTLEKVKSNYEDQLKELEDKRKELEYISRKGIKPFSEKETKEAAEKHHRELEEMSKNPEGATAEKWEKAFQRDQKYLADQIDILKRSKGKEPIEPYKDRYIKTLESYNKVYKNLLKEVEEQLALAKSQGSRNKELERLQKNLETNLRINEAKLAKHKDKLASKEAVQKGSALMRHYLQQWRSDLPNMQKPIIETQRALEGTSLKAKEVGKEVLKHVHKIQNAIIENIRGKEVDIPEKEIEKVAETTDPGSVSKIKSSLKKLADAWREHKYSPDELVNRLRAIYKELPFLPRIITGTLFSAALKALGVPYWARLIFIPRGIFERGATTALGGYVVKGVNELKDMYLSGKFNALSSVSEKVKMKKDLIEKYGKTRANKIIRSGKPIPEDKKGFVSEFLETI